MTLDIAFNLPGKTKREGNLPTLPTAICRTDAKLIVLDTARLYSQKTWKDASEYLL